VKVSEYCTKRARKLVQQVSISPSNSQFTNKVIQEKRKLTRGTRGNKITVSRSEYDQPRLLREHGRSTHVV
jgi:hypothetical protein